MYYLFKASSPLPFLSSTHYRKGDKQISRYMQEEQRAHANDDIENSQSR